MELHDVWRKLETERLTKPVHGTITVPEKSKHPVQKLITGFRIALGFVVLFQIVFIYLLAAAKQPVVQAGIAVIIGIYVYFFIHNLQVLLRIQKLHRLDANIRETLQNIYNTVTRALAFQRRISLVFYPICAAAGFLLGLSLETDVLEVMRKPVIQLILAVTVVVLTPLSYLLARWMERISYGKYCAQLKDLMEQIRPDEP